jgi:hypothetical protein
VSTLRFVALVVVLSALCSGVIRAQETTAARSQNGTWELDAHGGWLGNIEQTRGSSSLPATGSIVGGQISVSSFFVGDGARLLAQGVTRLDPVLLRPAIQWQGQTGVVGIGLTRAIRRRLAAYISVDYNRSTLAATDATLAGVEATRTSVTRTLQQVLSGSSVPSSVSAVTSVNDRQGWQLAAMGAVLVYLRETGKTIPYVTGGGGVLFNRIDAADVTLTGRYELGMPAQIFWTDSVRVHSAANGREYIGMAGAGLKQFVTPRWGVRVEGRAYLLPNKTTTQVDTVPAIALRSTGSPYPIINAGTLQFSTTAPLTAAPVGNFATFTGTGVRAQARVTAGVFWRF